MLKPSEKARFRHTIAHSRAPFLISSSEPVFVPIGDSNHKGNVAELKILAAAADLGLEVSKPLTEHCRYDLIFDVGDRLLRVQCKWANQNGDVILIKIGGSYHSPTRGYVLSTYSASEVDAVAAYCGDNDRCYLIPIDVIDGQTCMHLRLAPARNGQLVALHFAADYELARGCSSAGRASGWQPLGQGFESPQLHSPSNIESCVGSEELRRRLGSLTHRAAAGETFNVTRRGKPFCRLTPPESLLNAKEGEINAAEPSPKHE